MLSMTIEEACEFQKDCFKKYDVNSPDCINVLQTIIQVGNGAKNITLPSSRFFDEGYNLNSIFLYTSAAYFALNRFSQKEDDLKLAREFIQKVLNDYHQSRFALVQQITLLIDIGKLDLARELAEWNILEIQQNDCLTDFMNLIEIYISQKTKKGWLVGEKEKYDSLFRLILEKLKGTPDSVLVQEIYEHFTHNCC